MISSFKPQKRTKCSLQLRKTLWLNARQPVTVPNRLNARQSEIFTDFPPKGSFRLQIFIQKYQAIPRNRYSFPKDKLSELERTEMSLGCRQLHASDQTASWWRRSRYPTAEAKKLQKMKGDLIFVPNWSSLQSPIYSLSRKW